MSRAMSCEGAKRLYQLYRLSRLLGAAVLAAGGAHAAQAQDLSSYSSGSGLYRAHCASCHGVDGHGDGPVASSLNVEVPDLTRISRRQGGRFPADQLRKIIDGRTTVPPHGTRTMPVWGQAFRAAGGDSDPQGERQASRLVDLLVQYLESIQAQ